MRSLSVILCLALSFGGHAALAQSKSKAKKNTKTKTTTTKTVKEESSIPTEDPSLTSPVIGTEATTGTTGLLDNNSPIESTPPATEAPVASTSNSGHDHGHLFGVHAAVGVPHPLNFGLNYIMPSHLLSFAVSTGTFSASASDVDLNIGNSEVALRWHPFYGVFYVGALYGQQNIKAKKTEIIQTQLVTAEVEVKSNYITPHIGWMWGAEDGGFFASMDIGYQSPSNVQTTFTSDANPAAQATPEYADLSRDVRDQGDQIGNTGLPYWSMIKVGWLF